MPGLEILKNQFKEYCNRNDKEVGLLHNKIDTIRDNHLSHIQQDITDLRVAVSDNARDIKWLTKIQWFSVTTGVATLIGIVVNTYLTLK